MRIPNAHKKVRAIFADFNFSASPVQNKINHDNFIKTYIIPNKNYTRHGGRNKRTRRKNKRKRLN